MTVIDGGPWRGPSTEEWVERIARGSTPVREYGPNGEFYPWIDTELRASAEASTARPGAPRRAGVRLDASVDVRELVTRTAGE